MVAEAVADVAGEVVDLARGVVGALLDPFAGQVQALRSEITDHPRLPLILLVVLLFCTGRAVIGDRLAALAVFPVSAAWLLFNGPLEGPTLFALSWSHGVTAADLVALAALMVASWRLAPVLVGR